MQIFKGGMPMICLSGSFHISDASTWLYHFAGKCGAREVQSRREKIRTLRENYVGPPALYLNKVSILNPWQNYEPGRLPRSLLCFYTEVLWTWKLWRWASSPLVMLLALVQACFEALNPRTRHSTVRFPWPGSSCGRGQGLDYRRCSGILSGAECRLK